MSDQNEVDLVCSLKESAVSMGFTVDEIETDLTIYGRTKLICSVVVKENYLSAECPMFEAAEHSEDRDKVVRAVKAWLFQASNAGESERDPAAM